MTSSICLAERYVWAFKRDRPASLLSAIDLLMSEEVTLVDFDSGSARMFGSLRVALRRQGIEINTTDLMIASAAIRHDLVLVTNNTADFVRIPGLRLENWL